MTTGTVSLLLFPGGAGHQGPTRRVRMFTVSAAVLVPFAILPLARIADAFFFSLRLLIYFKISSRHIPALPCMASRDTEANFQRFVAKKKKKKQPPCGRMARTSAVREVGEDRELAKKLGRPAGKWLGSAWLGLPVCLRVDSAADATAVLETAKQAECRRSAVRQRFPKVVLLDRNELPPPISFDLGLEETIPLSKPSYFPSEDVKQVVVQFLEQYFTIFDSKDRSGLLDAYHDNAIFSMGACKLPYTKTDVKEFFRENRNLMRLSNIESRRERLKSGRVNIVSFLNQLPETRHDPSSFTVDIPLVTPTLMCFTVFGILRTVSRNLIVPALRSFTRTFFVVPQGAGFSIVNETLFITGGTDDQIRTYPVPDNPPPTPAAPAAAAAAAVAPIPAVVPVEQERMILELCAQTRMNRAFSERCLQQNDWNIQKAFTIFSELNARGSIPAEAFQP